MLKKQKKVKVTREQRIQKVVATIGQQLGPAYEEALNAYAEEKGRNWAEQLTLDWYHARDDRFQHNGKLYGPELRQIRNHPTHGPAFYDAFNG